MKKKIAGNVSFVGYIDWDLKNFHGVDYKIRNGSSQNAYLIEEEKTVLIDTVYKPNKCDFVKNLENSIDLKKIDYIVINHAECDHSGALCALIKKIPNVPIFCSMLTKNSLVGQYGDLDFNFNIVKNMDELDIGCGKKLKFIDMKMLHWPDSMATYLTGDEILFSNDAFGQHFAVEELFADKADPLLLEKEALKYFVNILNPFSPILLKKLDELENLNLPIKIIAPSHGAIWRKNPTQILEKYRKWADGYSSDQITIVYDTMWEGTKKLANHIANEISLKKPDTIVKVFNISKTDKNEITTEIFKSYMVFVGSPTVNNSIMSSVAGFLEYVKQLKFKNKKAAAFGCYGWSGESVKILQEKLKEAGFDVNENVIKSLWNPNKEFLDNIKVLNYI